MIQNMKNETNALLSIDKNFKPAYAEDGDELYPNGIFVFNITKMMAYLEKNPDEIVPELVSVKEYRSSLASLNEDHIETTDYTVPIILAEISPGRYNVVDGNHRIEKAYRSNVELISAYRLAPKQHMPFLTTVKSYQSYVEYWNSKLDTSHTFPKARRRQKQVEG